MICASLNGQEYSFLTGGSILQAAAAAGIEIPTLCHDERVNAGGNCRLCLVEIEGRLAPVAACLTPIAAGMAIHTHTPALESARRATLRMLARRYPEAAAAHEPDRPFHRWLRHYGVAACGAPGTAPPDLSHPYLQIDMSRCIHCYRCVRICDELQGQFVWHLFGRGDQCEVVSGAHSPLAATGCVSCGACADTCPTGAIADKPLANGLVPEKWTRTTCPYCGTGCELNVGSAGNTIAAIRPELDAPVSKGHLCVKGRYAFQFTAAPDRVTSPMLRRNGRWEQVSWSEAIAFTAAAIQRIRGARGPDAIGVLGSARATNEENYVAQKFARAVIGTNNVDCCARVCHAPTAAAMSALLGTGAATNSFNDIERARTLFVFGANATENHPIVGARIKQTARKGANLIVVDPRQTELAQLATLHLQLRPGTDVALLNAIAHVLLAEHLTDAQFLKNRVDGLGAFQTAVAGWPPERAAAVCGVDAAQIRRAARLYACSPTMSIHGLGITEHAQGTEGVMGLVNLALLTGNLGRPGAGVNPLRGQNNVQGAAHMGCEPEHLAGYALLANARQAFEKAWNQALPQGPGKHLLAMMDSAAAGDLAALWTIGYDIFLTNAAAAETRRALARLELIVVQDMFLNETAREFAHVFFPCASSFEKDGTFMNAERRVQRVRKAIDPPGEARTDWKILCDVAAAMGHPQGFAFTSAEQIWDEVRGVWKAGAGMSYARLETGGLQWPCPAEDHPGTPILHRDAFPNGPKAPLAPLDWHAPPDAPSPEFPFVLVTGRSLYQFNAATMTARTPNSVLRPTDTLDLSPADAARLGVRTGDPVKVTSRYGSAELPVRMTSDVRPGEAFATFHSAAIFLNQVTNPFRDPVTGTPDYKVTAINVQRLPA